MAEKMGQTLVFFFLNAMVKFKTLVRAERTLTGLTNHIQILEFVALRACSFPYLIWFIVVIDFWIFTITVNRIEKWIQAAEFKTVFRQSIH